MLAFEALEPRDLPAVNLSPTGLLSIQPEGGGTHTVSVDQVGDQIQVTVDSQMQSFAAGAVSRLLIQAEHTQPLVAQNNTTINSTLIGGIRADTLFGGLGQNLILPGRGDDIVYALLGSNTILSAGQGADRIFTNNSATVQAGSEDLVVRFFAPGRTPGTPFIGVENNVLYITPSNNGSRVQIDTAGPGRTQVTADLGDGLGLRQQTFAGVRAISYFGGRGNDTYVNNTALTEAAYGSAGNDVLVSGTGHYSLLKGSGGDDVLVGRAGQVDLSGNSGADILLRLGPGRAGDVFRIDGLDFVSVNNKRGVFITP